MNRIKLFYITKKYTIPFEVEHWLSPLENGTIDRDDFMSILRHTVGNFGTKDRDMPQSFIEMMEDKDMDAFLEIITMNIEYIYYRFYVAVPTNKNIMLAQNKDGDIFRLFAVNEAYSAIEPLYKSNDFIIFGNHEMIAKKFTVISSTNALNSSSYVPQ